MPHVNSALGNIEAPGKRAEGLLPQVHFVACIVLRCDFMPLVTNIDIQFVRLVIVECQTKSIEPNPVTTPESEYGLLSFFCAFPDIIYRMYQTMVFKLVCPEKDLGRAALLIVSICLLMFIYMCFLNSNNLPWIIAFSVTFVYKVH